MPGAVSRLHRLCGHVHGHQPPPRPERAAGTTTSISSVRIAVTLTGSQKVELYHHGFTIVRGVVSPTLLDAARRRLATGPREGLGQCAEVQGLLSHTPLRTILADLSGQVRGDGGEWGCFPTIIPAPEHPAAELSPLAWASRDLHIDDGGRNFVDAEETVGIKPFTTFVFVPLSDQAEPGQGQTHVLRGGHIAMEEFFRYQLSTYGRVGQLTEEWTSSSDRSSWPQTSNGRAVRALDGGIASSVRLWFAQSAETSIAAEDGAAGRLPRPTPLLLRAGDAAIATFALPHAGSPNDFGPERQQMIFRYVPPELEKIKCGQPNTFPDWAPREDGSWYPFSAEECDAVRAQLTDCWKGWAGMQDVAAKERPKTERARAQMQRLFRRVQAQ